MKFVRNAWTLFKTTMTMQTNSFIYLLRRLPFIQYLIPVSLYRKHKLKNIFVFGGLLKGFLGAAIGSTLWCFMTLDWFPAWLSAQANANERLLLFLLIECLASAIMSCSIFQAKEADYVFLNHFMMNPAEYYHYKIGKEAMSDMLFYLPVLMYLLRDPKLIAVAATATLFFTLAGCRFYLFVYDRLHGMIKKGLRKAIGFGIGITAYLCQKFGLFAGLTWNLSFCLVLCIVFTGCSVLFYLQLLKYKDYKRIAVQFANKDSAILTVSVNNAAEEGQDALSGTNYEENRSYFEKNCTLDTATYLNTAFFKRFEKIFSNQRKQIFILSIFLGALFGYLIRSEVLHITNETILNYTPILISLVSSSMLFGERFTTLCFRYMDMPLMYHHICKTEYLKKSIRCRYIFLLKHSLVALIGLTIFISLVLMIGGLRISFQDFVFLLIAMELFMLIKETYHLLIYYRIQPYTVDIAVKSPIFRALGVLEGLFDISALFLRGNLALACLPLAGLLLIVHAILLIVAQTAHRTFRLR